MIDNQICTVPTCAIGDAVGNLDGDGAAFAVTFGTVGVDAEDGVLSGGVLVHVGAAHGEVAVAAAAPAEVEMEVVGVVVAVAKEGMAAFAAGTAVGERHSSVKVGFQHVLPLGYRVLREVFHPFAGVVEIVGECGGQVFRVGAAAVAAVHHLHSDTAVVRKAGHLRAHQRIGARLNGSGHQVVKVDGVAEVGGKGSEVNRGIVHRIGMVGVGACAAHGPFPKAEQLCRCRGHTAGYGLDGVAAVVVDGAHAVVVGILVPRGLDERSHHHRAGGTERVAYFLPLGSHLFRGRVGIGDGSPDFIAITFQYIVQAGGDAFRVESTFGGVGQHRFRAVVGGNDDIAVAPHVHHVETGHFHFGADPLCDGVGGGHHDFHCTPQGFGRYRLVEILRHRYCACGVNGIGISYKGNLHQRDYQCSKERK